MVARTLDDASGGERLHTSASAGFLADTLPPGVTGWVRATTAGLSVFAGLIHLVVAPEHFDVGFEFGAFMVIVGLCQVVAGVLLFTRPVRPVVLATIFGTLVVFAVFAVAYTVGLPFGPMPGESEELNAPVIVSKLAELSLLVLLVRCGRGLMRNADAPPRFPA